MKISKRRLIKRALTGLSVLVALMINSGRYRLFAESQCHNLVGREFTIDYYGFQYRGNTTNLIDRYVLCEGAWEKHISDFLRAAAEALAEAPVVFVDIGANSGVHTLFMSRYADTVHAFEPYPVVLDRLRRNVSDNALQNVIIHPIGLGHKKAKLRFYEPPESNEGTGSFVAGLMQGNFDRGLELQIVAGDEYFERAKISKVDLIKMDIEGYEKPALQGLRRTLESQRPIVVMEVPVRQGVDHLFQSDLEMQEVFPTAYRFLHLSTDSNGHFKRKPDQINFSAARGQGNFVALPAEALSVIPLTGRDTDSDRP